MFINCFIRKFSYLTSRNYLAWVLGSLLFFLPATMFVLLINALARGLWVAVSYLKQRDFNINFSYRTYLLARSSIEKSILKS